MSPVQRERAVRAAHVVNARQKLPTPSKEAQRCRHSPTEYRPCGMFRYFTFTPPPLSKLRKSPKFYGPYAYCSLDKAPAYANQTWCKNGVNNAQISEKLELCGFKWANTHKTCVHDPM